MSKEKTLFVVTGGTIEAMYHPEDGTPFYVPVPAKAEESCIPAALELLGMDALCDVHAVTMRDSKEVTTQHLDHILAYAAEQDYARIVIVHGTDTMPLHARYVKRRLAEWGQEQGMDTKTFVFTGAMEPLRDTCGQWRSGADGWKNLAMAFEDARQAPPGVYVEMGEGPKEADRIAKHVEVDQPLNRAAKVVHSGFIAEDPSRHITEIF